MRKRSGQVHSRESSATLQLTVSLLYQFVVRKCPACENKIGKEDRYCKYCGQKINVMSEENIIRGNVIEEEENSREIQ